MNDGEIFNVMTNGRRSMPPYRYQIVSRDRWAIVAYVRALQRTSMATVADVPETKSGAEIAGSLNTMIQHAITIFTTIKSIRRFGRADATRSLSSL